MLFSFFLALLFFNGNSASSKVIDVRKPTTSHQETLDKKFIGNMVYNYNSEAEYMPEPSGFSSDNILVDNDGRKMPHRKRDMGIKVTDPNTEKDKESASSLEMAYAAFQAQDIDRALHYYQKSLQIKPNSVEAIFGTGSCYHFLGNQDEAEKMYIRVLKINPKHSDAINNLMEILSKKDLNLAIETLENIVKNGSQNPTLIAQLGTLIAQTENYSKALRCLRVALNYDENNPTILYNIAILYELLDNNKMALRFYKLTLEEISVNKVPDIKENHVKEKIRELSELYGK